MCYKDDGYQQFLSSISCSFSGQMRYRKRTNKKYKGLEQQQLGCWLRWGLPLLYEILQMVYLVFEFKLVLYYSGLQYSHFF